MAKLMILPKQIRGINDEGGHMKEKTWLLAVFGTCTSRLPATKCKIKVRKSRMIANLKTEGKMLRLKADPPEGEFSKEYLW